MFKRESKSTCFFANMAPCLWRADLSFRNSVTGSGSRAKCSNILHDAFFQVRKEPTRAELHTVSRSRVRLLSSLAAKNFARHKRSSLFCHAVGDEGIFFITLTPEHHFRRYEEIGTNHPENQRFIQLNKGLNIRPSVHQQNFFGLT